MILRAAIAAVALVATSTLASAADPIGYYSMKGHNPEGGDYSGTVAVTQTGKTYEVVWVIGGDTYVGTALGNDQFFAVSYKSGYNTGLAMYAEKGDNWEGIWTYAGGKTVGIEAWARE